MEKNMAPKAFTELELKIQQKVEQDDLLENLKNNLNKLESHYEMFCRNEPDDVYRFYHQSFKVFGMTNQIKSAKSLFDELAPANASLNPWFTKIFDEAIDKEFNDEANQNWLRETRPILEGFWHAKYFLEQMIRSVKKLDTAPAILPSGWAAVLYLYNLR